MGWLVSKLDEWSDANLADESPASTGVGGGGIGRVRTLGALLDASYSASGRDAAERLFCMLQHNIDEADDLLEALGSSFGATAGELEELTGGSKRRPLGAFSGRLHPGIRAAASDPDAPTAFGGDLIDLIVKSHADRTARTRDRLTTMSKQTRALVIRERRNWYAILDAIEHVKPSDARALRTKGRRGTDLCLSSGSGHVARPATASSTRDTWRSGPADSRSLLLRMPLSRARVLAACRESCQDPTPGRDPARAIPIPLVTPALTAAAAAIGAAPAAAPSAHRPGSGAGAMAHRGLTPARQSRPSSALVTPWTGSGIPIHKLPLSHLP